MPGLGGTTGGVPREERFVITPASEIMAIMALISAGSGSSFVLELLYVVVAVMIPISQFGFIFVIWHMEQEG